MDVMELACVGRVTLAIALLFSSPVHGHQSEPNSVVKNLDKKGACGPCCGKDLAAEARATQGISAANPANPYVGKDRYDNVVVREGTLFYSLTPGSSPGFAVSYPTLEKAGGSLTSYYALVQVTTDPGKDAAGLPRSLRDKVRAFRVRENICVARGKALANPQFGRGGGTQYYFSPSDATKLDPERIRPI
jgi:hypothetical protein